MSKNVDKDTKKELPLWMQQSLFDAPIVATPIVEKAVVKVEEKPTKIVEVKTTTTIVEAPELEEVEVETKVLSVSDLNRKIKGELESTFGVVWVQGEIS